jgi:hypothetical protein
MKRIAYILFLSVLVASCKKDSNTVEVDLGYDYFPNTVGTYIIYEVDSTGYGLDGEVHAEYQVMEVLAEEFVDGENQLSVKVERFKRINNSDLWALTDVWTQKRTNQSAQRIEEDIRYVRLGFPIELEKTWDGNAYNLMEPWNYKITQVDAPAVFNGLSFEQTVTVFQRNNINLIDQEIASEVYARGVGLVYKQLTDIEIQQGDMIGVDMTMKILEYGVVEE